LFPEVTVCIWVQSSMQSKSQGSLSVSKHLSSLSTISGRLDRQDKAYEIHVHTSLLEQGRARFQGIQTNKIGFLDARLDKTR
jgi:hypothetical protein